MGMTLRERRVRIDMAADDVEEIELPRTCQAPCDFYALVPGKPLFEIFVGDHADADNEIWAYGASHRVDHGPGESQPVLQRAAIVVLSPVGRR